MHDAIQSHLEKLKIQVEFPPKRYLTDHFDAAFIREREVALQKYLDVVSSEVCFVFLCAFPSIAFT
jgi:hypothetical protein